MGAAPAGHVASTVLLIKPASTVLLMTQARAHKNTRFKNGEGEEGGEAEEADGQRGEEEEGEQGEEEVEGGEEAEEEGKAAMTMNSRLFSFSRRGRSRLGACTETEE